MRRFLVAAAAVVIVASGTAAQASPTSADLAVGLGATGSLLISTVTYSVSVTNNGPDALTSASVTVRVDSRVGFMTGTSPCALDKVAATLTCSFGGLPSGATATDKATVYFYLQTRPFTVKATATRTSSTPADPNSANDSAAHDCFWVYNGGIGAPPSRMYC
jgi:hypothetical protein